MNIHERPEDVARAKLEQRALEERRLREERVQEDLRREAKAWEDYWEELGGVTRCPPLPIEGPRA